MAEEIEWWEFDNAEEMIDQVAGDIAFIIESALDSRGQALVAFPGGFGTLDELFEVLTLVQTGKTKPVPIVLFGTRFWKRLIDFDFLVEEGTVSPNDLHLFHYTDEPQEAWGLIKSFYQL